MRCKTSQTISELILLFFLSQQHLMAHAESPQEAYVLDIMEANAQIASFHDQGSCVSGEIAVSCGDDLCELFENLDNCPQDCVPAELKSYNHQISCPEVQEIYAPQTISDVVSIIRGAKSQGLSVRAVGSKHSVNRQLCSQGIIISTQDLDRIVGIERDDNGSEYVIVEPGVTMGELAEWLHRRERSLGYALLGFRLATVGGAIATGAHGSSPRHSAVLSSAVHGVTLVSSDGDVQEITKSDGDLLRAARAHLGLLGIIVQIKLKIHRQFRLHVQNSHHTANFLMQPQGLNNAIKDCDYALINWFPLQNRLIKTCGVETSRWVDFNAENILLKANVLPGLIAPFKLALHYGHCYESLNHFLESARYSLMVWKPFFQKRFFFDGSFGRIGHSSNLVGYSHRMMTSEFDAGNQHFFQNDWELAIPMSKVDQALQFMLQHSINHGLHFPLIGVFLRFAPAEDKALLAHSTSVGAFSPNEGVVFMEFPTPTPLGFPNDAQARIDGPFLELVNTLITEYSARPHWGKNAPHAFLKQNEVNAYGANLDTFKTIALDLDPDGMFANDFFKQLGFREEFQ